MNSRKLHFSFFVFLLGLLVFQPFRGHSAPVKTAEISISSIPSGDFSFPADAAFDRFSIPFDDFQFEDDSIDDDTLDSIVKSFSYLSAALLCFFIFLVVEKTVPYSRCFVFSPYSSRIISQRNFRI